MGELTPGTQLSMGSAKRLYVLMAGFYTQRPFETSAVKWRHKIVAFRSPVLPHVSAGTSCYFTNAGWATQLLMCPWHGPQFCKLYSMCSERGDSHRSATGSLRSDSHDRGGARGVKSSVREKICEVVHQSKGPVAWMEVRIHAAIVRRAGLLGFKSVIPKIWSKTAR